MQTVLLEACGEAGASRRCDSGLETVKPLAEELVSVSPLKLALLVVYVLAAALVALFVNNLSQHWVLHCNARELTDVVGCRLVVLVREPVGVGVVR